MLLFSVDRSLARLALNQCGSKQKGPIEENRNSLINIVVKDRNFGINLLEENINQIKTTG